MAAWLSYDYAGQSIWLDDAAADIAGHHSGLCAAHAGRLRAPVGWSCVDRRTARPPAVPGAVTAAVAAGVAAGVAAAEPDQVAAAGGHAVAAAPELVEPAPPQASVEPVGATAVLAEVAV